MLLYDRNGFTVYLDIDLARWGRWSVTELTPDYDRRVQQYGPFILTRVWYAKTVTGDK